MPCARALALRTLGPTASLPKHAELDPLSNCAQSSRALQEFDLGFPGFGERPIHLLVNKQSLLRSTKSIITHASLVEYPKNAFVKLNGNIFVASPELCLVQMSRYLTDVQLGELAMNLCADYFIHPLTGKIEKRSRNITTLGKLHEFARASSLRGAVKARQCLTLALPNSRSPQETKLSILLRRHETQGGEGFPSHIVNYQPDIAKRSHLVEQDVFYIDIAYPRQKVGIEYYGEEYHQDPRKDRRRINGLTSLGWTILTLEKQQLYNPELFAVFTGQLAARLGLRQSRPWNWGYRNRQLRNELGLTF